jgi:hypothetical protein
MWVLMNAAEREEFLAGVHVGVLSAAVGKTGRTLAVPVWYSYQPGGLLTVLTGRRSRKAGAIHAAGRFGLCVQDDSPPYRYVSVEGPVVSEEELDPAERLAMARRYLGSAGGALAQPGSGQGICRRVVLSVGGIPRDEPLATAKQRTGAHPGTFVIGLPDAA